MSHEVPYGEILVLLMSRGWRETRFEGGYHIFTKPGRIPISVRVFQERVKRAHVKQIEWLVALDQSIPEPCCA